MEIFTPVCPECASSAIALAESIEILTVAKTLGPSPDGSLCLAEEDEGHKVPVDDCQDRSPIEDPWRCLDCEGEFTDAQILAAHKGTDHEAVVATDGVHKDILAALPPEVGKDTIKFMTLEDFDGECDVEEMETPEGSCVGGEDVDVDMLVAVLPGYAARVLETDTGWKHYHDEHDTLNASVRRCDEVCEAGQAKHHRDEVFEVDLATKAVGRTMNGKIVNLYADMRGENIEK